MPYTFRFGFAVVTILLLSGIISRGDDRPPYLDKSAAVEDRVNDLMGRLTFDEKILLLAGRDACTTPPIDRLKIPPMRMADAGAGVRGIDKTNGGDATNFTSGVMMASTWDPALLGQVGAAIGQEAHNKNQGSQILLGPAVNIQRSPLGGRNGEYFSEDPYLAGQLAVAYIKGMQGEGTAACLKHFACNNEEVDRGSVDVVVSERALREIYLPAFAAGVREGHVWTIMSSYNQVNGFHSSANAYLLTDVLKKGWNFDGTVISDWGGVHEAAGSVKAGNDIEMPGPPKQVTPANVKAALASGALTPAQIDDAVRRTVRTMVRTGLLDGPWQTNPALVNSPAHQKLSREVAEQGIVLLKNENAVLPLDAATIHSIAIVGPAAKAMQIGAEGSPNVHPPYTVGPLQGITERVGRQVRITCVPEDPTIPNAGLPRADVVPEGDPSGHGWSGSYFNNRDLQGTPVAKEIDPSPEHRWTAEEVPAIPGLATTDISVRWSGRLIAPVTGRYKILLGADNGSRLYVGGKCLIDHWMQGEFGTRTVALDLVAGQSYPIRVEYFHATGDSHVELQWRVPPRDNRAAEIAAAKGADVAIVCVSTYKIEGEGHDRPSMSLPNHQDALVRAVVAVNKNTIVVLNNGTPIDMRAWLGQVPAVVEAWLPGMEGGHALAAILFGDVDPSGKLPTTLAARREDYPDFGNFPGQNGRVHYAEGIYVGYRHFDKEGIAPLFPFGFGLSYTTFAYGALQLSAQTLAADGTVTVSLPIQNTGKRAGAEVVQLYVHDPAPKIDKPVRELKGFSKVELAPGETKTVLFSVTPSALAYFDTPGKQWKANAGDYEIQVGGSSRDIRQKATIHLSRDYTQAVPLSHDFVDAAVKTAP